MDGEWSDEDDVMLREEQLRLHGAVPMLCAHCITPITKRVDVGWTHDWALNNRDGCTNPEP